MKSSASIAISLTLLMFILVLSAAVFFLLQGQQDLKSDLTSSEGNIKTLRQQQAENELDERAVQATLEIVQNSHATSAVENMNLEGQLLDSIQVNGTLEALSDQRSTELDNISATVTNYESQGPVVNIVEPQAGVNLTVGQPVEIVIVASDSAGVAKVIYNIGNELFSPTVEAGPVVTLREQWQPTTAGTFTLAASAINNNEITSQSSQYSTVIIIVNDPEPTNTPEPTETAPPESTPESTPGS